MFSWSSFYTLALLCVLSYLAKRVLSPRPRLPLPPGPPGHWLFGNQLPKSRAAYVFAKMTEKYGPVFSVRQGTRLFVIIGRHKAAMDIMERQGASLAGRPHSVAASETLSGDMRVLLMTNGDRFRRLRRVLHLMLQPRVSATYEPIQLQHAKEVLLDILNDPKNHQLHVKRYAASTLIAITYGKTTPTAYSDPEVVEVNRCLQRLGHVNRPGSYIVDTWPILKYLPGYLTELKQWHKEELALFQGQLDLVREQMRKGEARPSFAKFLLENQTRHGIFDEEVAYVAGSMFGAGSDTTASAISIMVMCAALHPEAQAKVREELDSLCGRERLPVLGEQESHPQLTAFMLETLRWRPVGIGGFGHYATEDVVWENYLIPKGATVIGNHWAIANDTEVYPNPEKFDPQRWLTEDGTVRDDLRFPAFGFGRRICPGQHLANRSLFINTAYILWAFRLKEDPAHPIDSFGFTDAANMSPLPFEVVFEPRMPVTELRRICTADD